MRVLIVDDDPDCRHIMALMLSKQGWGLSFAENGYDAIRMALHENPDLILMDLLMPICSGLEAVVALRGDERTAHTPIFAITALAFDEDRHRAFEAGFDQVITKPFARRQLLESIHRQFPELSEPTSRVPA